MAKLVKMPKNREFVFKAPSKGKESRYDWAEWFKTNDDGQGQLLMLEQSAGDKDDNGDVVEVTEKRDYESRTDQMPGKIKAAARRHYKVVQISRTDYDNNKLENSLIIKARDMTPDEVEAEDIRRAEEKAALVTKRQEKKHSKNDQDEDEAEAA